MKDSNNKVVFYKNNDFYPKQSLSSSIGLTYRNNIHNTHSIQFGIENYKFSDSLLQKNENYTVDNQNKLNYFTLYYQFKNDYRNYKPYPLQGHYFDIEITNVNTPYNDGKEDGLEEKEVMAKPSLSLQQIFYGAPGTGKSHTIKEETKESDVIRTTFHPDTDYSTFVGAYKPTTALLPICDELGQPMKID